MFGENEPQQIVSASTEETIAGVLCEGFCVVAKTDVGIFLLTDGEGVQRITTRENLMNSFKEQEFALKLQDEVMRKAWDDIHLICVHAPKNTALINDYTSSVFGGNQIGGSTVLIPIIGIPMVQDFLKFKAFDLHDDLIAEANLEREMENVKAEEEL